MSEKSTVEKFIEKANKVHKNRYDYSKVEYINNKTKVCIICPEHGEFWQRPDNHLYGQRCPVCGKNLNTQHRTSNTEEFVNKSKALHNNKYDYSKVNYVNNHIPVEIICFEHGSFFQKPNVHLNGRGCPVCANNIKLTTEKFIEKARQIHGDKYDYSKADCSKVKNNKTKLEIICPSHGIFLQSANAHLHGYGCPRCEESSGERKMRLFCEKNGYKKNIDYFLDYRGYKWLGLQHLDCCFPDLNLAFEYDGEQHFMPVCWKGAIPEQRMLDDFTKTKEKDKLKNELCEQNGITLVRIPYWEKENIENIMKKSIVLKEG